MKVTITESKKNDLLKRTEMTGTVSFDTATPRRTEVKKAIAVAAKCKEDFLVVKKIDSHYGGKTATVTAFSYSDKDFFEKVEKEYMRKRNAVVKEAEEETPEGKAEEAPAQESAETPKEESPKEAEQDAEKKEGGE